MILIKCNKNTKNIVDGMNYTNISILFRSIEETSCQSIYCVIYVGTYKVVIVGPSEEFIVVTKTFTVLKKSREEWQSILCKIFSNAADHSTYCTVIMKQNK